MKLFTFSLELALGVTSLNPLANLPGYINRLKAKLSPHLMLTPSKCHQQTNSLSSP